MRTIARRSARLRFRNFQRSHRSHQRTLTHEAAEIIDRLQKIAEPKKTPLRTIQYRRRNAGVDQIVTVDQLNLLNNLWFAKEGRTANGLEMLCNRIIKREKPRTTKECNKVIEAVKSMNSRGNVVRFPKKNKEAA